MDERTEGENTIGGSVTNISLRTGQSLQPVDIFRQLGCDRRLIVGLIYNVGSFVLDKELATPVKLDEVMRATGLG